MTGARSGMIPAVLVIFDCDGVLVDSERISNAVLANALAALGLAITAEEAHDRYRGMFLAEIRADAERRLGSPLPPDFVETFERDREDAFGASLQPVPGAASAVAEVKAMGLTCAWPPRGSCPRSS